MEPSLTHITSATTPIDKQEKADGKAKQRRASNWSNSKLDSRKLTSRELARLEKMNEQFAHVITGNKHLVIKMPVGFSNITEPSFESIKDFKYRFLHEPQISGLNAGDAWLRWQNKRFCPGGLEFSPGFQLESPDKLNLFRGFAVKPVAGDVEPFLFHVREVICKKDEILTKYVLQFFAHLLQKPGEKPSVALLLKSMPGAGKNALYAPFKKILGEYAQASNGDDPITGRFNSSLANKLLVFGDEVDLRSRKSLDRMKSLISENTLQVEYKGREMTNFPNYIRFFFATNLDQVLRADARERRYVILEPSQKLAQNIDYFKHYFDWVENRNGPAHLMHYLLNLDISDFNRHVAPKSRGLIDEKLSNLSIVAEFFYEELRKDFPFSTLGQNAEVKALEQQFRSFVFANGDELRPSQVRSILSRFMSTLSVPKEGRSGRGNGIVYDLSNVVALRQRFAQYLDENIEELFA